MRRTSLFVGLATIASAGLILLASPATAYPPTAPNVTLTSYAVQGGDQDTAHGTGFGANEGVDGFVHSTTVLVGHATTNANGSVTMSFTVPSSLAAGQHSFELVGNRSGRSASVNFTVLPGVSNSSSGSGLPFTGGNAIWPMTGVGAGLVVIGGLALFVRRRRSHAGVAA